MLKRFHFLIPALLLIFLSVLSDTAHAVTPARPSKTRIKAIGIPLADHYPGIIALEKYGPTMKSADFQFEMLPGPELVRAYFTSEEDADIAFNVSPMVIDMFIKNPDFKWVSLIHRDGNALTINQSINDQAQLHEDLLQRKPDSKVARAFKAYHEKTGTPIECAVPSLLATHTVILFKYLKENNLTMNYLDRESAPVFLRIVTPPKSMAYLKKSSARNRFAAFEQSLPWPNLAEIGNFGQIAWYSKDVMNHPKGHVECIIIAKNRSLKEKRSALNEVILAIHRAGQDIERARRKGGREMDTIVKMIRKHIPTHSKKAILQSLRPDLNVINYSNLNVDKNSIWSLNQIMNLAFEAGFINRKIDVHDMADKSFSSKITIRQTGD
jgi:NitT/TauT family transport system substrate-binding protein